MLTRSPAVRIYLATGATDLRRSIDGLAALVRERFTLDPLSGRLKTGMDVTLSPTRNASDLRRARVPDEHDRIVHAIRIRIGGADSAAIAMRYHLDQARNRLLDRHLDR